MTRTTSRSSNNHTRSTNRSTWTQSPPAKLVLLALSFDALLDRGDWEIVGNHTPPSLRWPHYAEAIAPGVFEAVDHTGKVRRRIDEAEAATLPMRSLIAPNRVQNAYRALHGAAPWHEAYDRLRY